MAKTFTLLTRSAIRKLDCGHKINEHGIIFERLPNAAPTPTALTEAVESRYRHHRVTGLKRTVKRNHEDK